MWQETNIWEYFQESYLEKQVTYVNITYILQQQKEDGQNQLLTSFKSPMPLRH